MEIQTIIGIDPGVNTGMAIIINGRYTSIRTTTLHRALIVVHALHIDNPIKEIIIEDARQSGASKYMAAVKAQGAGSVKRDCKVWEEFCTDYKIPFTFVRPQKILRKVSDEWFKRTTGWKERTSNHSRDAACLILHKLKTT